MTVVGLQWVQSTNTYSSPTGDSIGSLTPATRVAACNAIDPWMSMVRCNLWDTGVQTATGANSNTSTAADRCYTDTDVSNMGQVMVKLKKFWYATDFSTAGTYRWFISSTGADSKPTTNATAWKVHPAFTRNSVTKSQIYLGAYEAYGTSPLQSVSGVTPSGSNTLAQFRTAAEARGTGWEVQDYLSVCAIQLLMLLEYGSFNFPMTLGYGITSDSVMHVTGETGSTGTDKGDTSYGATGNATTAMSYRGIENVWGNLITLVDGVNMNTDVSVWVADHGFATGIFTSPYVTTSLTPIHSDNNYGSDITTNATYDYGFLAAALAGGLHTYLCTWYAADLMSGTAAQLYLGGAYNHGVESSAFAQTWYTQTYSDPTCGCRLMYVG